MPYGYDEGDIIGSWEIIIPDKELLIKCIHCGRSLDIPRKEAKKKLLELKCPICESKDREIKSWALTRALSGKKFGNLIIEQVFYDEENIDQFGEGPIPKRNDVPIIFAYCKCPICGNRQVFELADIISGKIINCGITPECSNSSKGEKKVWRLLWNYGIYMNRDVWYTHDECYFKDLKTTKGGIGRYDFVIWSRKLNKGNEVIRLVEVDGEQHCKEGNFFPRTLKERQKDDQIKNEYAWSHNIPLIRIPYSAIDSLTIEDIFSDKYLVKPQGNPFP